MITNAMVVANELKCLEGVSNGIRAELDALAEFLGLLFEWTDIDKMDLGIAMTRKAVELIQLEAKELAGNVETLKEHCVLAPRAKADLEGAA